MFSKLSVDRIPVENMYKIFTSKYLKNKNLNSADHAFTENIYHLNDEECQHNRGQMLEYDRV